MIVLLTGATGFIGKAVVDKLSSHSFFTPRAVVRCAKHHISSSVSTVKVKGLAPSTDWNTALHGVDVVVHMAARVHVLREESLEPLKEFREINVKGTLNLARQAVAVGVKRFVFISSIGVSGNQNKYPFVEDSRYDPVEPYAVSKMEAEKKLLQFAEESGLEVVIIRPPLVYGPNAPGNFGRLIRVVEKGIPLPLGAIHNKRSLVFLDNLVDFIITCIDHPSAANQVLLVSDGEDLSTTELLKRLGSSFGKPARLLPVPQAILEFILKILGKGDIAQRLCGSLRVDISKARDLLGWQPPVSVGEGFKRTAEWYLRQEK